MKRVYIASAISADNPLKFLDNIREGQRLGTEVLLAGFSPFVPCFDFHFQLNLRDCESLDKADYYQYSMEWLKVSHAVLVHPNHKKSIGVKEEIEMADKYGIPVFYSLEKLKRYF